MDTFPTSTSTLLFWPNCCYNNIVRLMNFRKYGWARWKSISNTACVCVGAEPHWRWVQKLLLVSSTSASMRCMQWRHQWSRMYVLESPELAYKTGYQPYEAQAHWSQQVGWASYNVTRLLFQLKYLFSLEKRLCFFLILKGKKQVFSETRANILLQF